MIRRRPSLLQRAAMYLRAVGFRVELSTRFLRRLRDTPRADRTLIQGPRLSRMPLCWLRGHRFEGQSFVIVSWRMQFCTCCREEIAGRTRWSEISPQPTEPAFDIPHFSQEGFL